MPPPSTAEEISRQFDLVWGERHLRLGLTAGAFSLTTIYLPLWIAALCCAVDLLAEVQGMRAMRGLDPQKHPGRYRFVLLCTFIMEFAFALCAGLIWMQDENLAKPFAMGMVMTTMLHVATTRAIHLPFGIVGIAGVMVPLLACNTVYWIGLENWLGLGLSTLSAMGGAAYILTATMSNNTTHRNSALQREAALEADRGKSRFLAQMSHELRTPLNAILGMGHAELRRSQDALSQKRLSVLIASAEGLSTILDDILDMSAVQEGRLPIRPQPVVPKSEILATLALFQPGIDEAGLELRSEIAREAGTPALMDPQRLRQCLSNLLSNALKHTANGEIRVRADVLPGRDGQSPTLQIEVSDTGAGIPDALHEAIFEPFFKSPQQAGEAAGLQASRKPSNGLGLSISRAMARQMGGDLRILPNRATAKAAARPDHNPEPAAQPADPGGATFQLCLPLAPVPEGFVRPMAAPPPASGAVMTVPQASAATGLRVLVVDDIATNRLVASTYLRMLGASMMEASGGEEALRLLSAPRQDLILPDLILLDMNMPEMDGMQTLARIRALPGAAARIPVIAMTADALEDQRKRNLDGGLDGYLVKPLNPTRINAEIEAVLNRTTHTAPLPDPG